MKRNVVFTPRARQSVKICVYALYNGCVDVTETQFSVGVIQGLNRGQHFCLVHMDFHIIHFKSAISVFEHSPIQVVIYSAPQACTLGMSGYICLQLYSIPNRTRLLRLYAIDDALLNTICSNDVKNIALIFCCRVHWH